MKTLSVIIPNYNNEKFLKKCIESIINQTYKPYEIIIVDDCSTDESRKIISSFQDKYGTIKSIYLDSNGGVSRARNIGGFAAKGDFITFIDADDYYYNDKKLEAEMSLIESLEAKHGQEIISYSKIVLVDECDNLIRKLDYKKYEYLVGNNLFKYLTGIKEKTIPRDYCFSKSIFEKVSGYDENMNLFEDLDLLIRISKHCKAFCTYVYGTGYRQKSYGLSKRRKDEIDRAKNDIFDKNILLLPQNQRSLAIFVRALVMFKRKISSYIKSIIKKYRKENL